MITGTETEDNARVFRENRFAVAALGDEQGNTESLNSKQHIYMNVYVYKLMTILLYASKASS